MYGPISSFLIRSRACYMCHVLHTAVLPLLSPQITGSVKGSNAAELMGQPDIDGALVGGAALVAKEFVQIYNAAPKAKL